MKEDTVDKYAPLREALNTNGIEVVWGQRGPNDKVIITDDGLVAELLKERDDLMRARDALRRGMEAETLEAVKGTRWEQDVGEQYPTSILASALNEARKERDLDADTVITLALERDEARDLCDELAEALGHELAWTTARGDPTSHKTLEEYGAAKVGWGKP